MAPNIKASGATTRRTARGLSGTQMATFTRENSKMTKATAMVSSLASIPLCMRASGRTIFSMVKAKLTGQMEVAMWVIIRREDVTA